MKLSLILFIAILFTGTMADNMVNVYVSAGSTSSPYYNFFSDASGSTPMDKSNGKTILDTSKKYTFHRLSEAASHAFYISDTGYESQRSDDINLIGDGSATSGILGQDTFTLEFTGFDKDEDTLTWFCTAHSNMRGTFALTTTSSASSSTTVKCSGNSDSREDVTCGTGTIFKDNPQDITKGSDSQGNCCESGYSFGLANINLCPDDAPVNIAWAGHHNIQESDGYNCTTGLKSDSEPLTFTGSTTLNGDDGFLVAGSRRPINASLLSDWNTVRYFRCTQHCSGARLKVTCNRANPSASSSSSPAAAPQQCEAPFNRNNYDSTKKDCHDADCDGSGNKCVDAANKVTSVCQCSPCDDIRVIMATVGEYCDEDGRWTPAATGKVYDNTTDTRNDDTLKTDWLIPTSDTLYEGTKNYIRNRDSTKEKKDMEDFGFVEKVVGAGGLEHKCADKCLLNYRNEEFHRAAPAGRRLRTENLKAASVSDFGKRGSDTCRDRECTLCPQCKRDASTKKYGYKPRIHAFISPAGEVNQHDAGCEETCENTFGLTHTDSGTFVVTAVTTMVSMTAAQKNTNFGNKKSVFAADATGTTGTVLVINGRVGVETYAIAEKAYTVDVTALSNCDFVILNLYDTPSILYNRTADGDTYTAPTAGTHLHYGCSNDANVIGGIIKVHSAENIQKINTCNGHGCSGCTKCKELLGTDEFDENTVAVATCNGDSCTAPVDLFAPVSPEEDINGDGSRIAGGCKYYCERAYTGIGRYWPALRGLSLSDADRQDEVCSWQRCSGCLQCKKRALNEDFAQLEPLSDYGDTKHERTKMKRMDGCSMPRNGDATTNCKLAYNAAGDDAAAKLEVCQISTDDRDCSGCKQCRTFVNTARQGYGTGDKMKAQGSRTAACTLKGEAAWCTKALASGTDARAKRAQRMGCTADCFY